MSEAVWAESRFRAVAEGLSVAVSPGDAVSEVAVSGAAWAPEIWEEMRPGGLCRVYGPGSDANWGRVLLVLRLTQDGMTVAPLNGPPLHAQPTRHGCRLEYRA